MAVVERWWLKEVSAYKNSINGFIFIWTNISYDNKTEFIYFSWPTHLHNLKFQKNEKGKQQQQQQQNKTTTTTKKNKQQ